MYHQQYMEESYKEPEVVPTIDSKDWTKTLETVEEYIRGFRGVYGQPFSYVFGGDLIALVTASDPMYRDNGSEYFTHYEEMIARGSILSGPAVLGNDPEDIGPFTDSFITNRALVWEKMVVIFQGSDAWTYLNPAKNYRDVRLGFSII